MSKNSTNNKAATTNNKVKNPADMSIQELMELKKSSKGVMVAIIEALITEKTKSEELQAKVKTSAKREPKAPDSYDILQPVFVALRGNIGKGIVKDTVLLDIFIDTANRLSVVLTEDISKRLFLKTVQHNSCSNIAKAESISSAKGRKDAYLEMVEQAKRLLCIPDKFWSDCLVEYNAAYDKSVSKLKK